MKCRDFEQDIYLYRELTLPERSGIDQHVKECGDCRKLLKIVLASQSMIVQASQLKAEPENFSRLTHTIMQAVEDSSTQKRFRFEFSFEGFIKYSLVTASLVLITFFVMEQQTSLEMPDRIARGETVPLRSQSVVKIIKEQKGKKEASLYACIKSDGCGNTLIENLKQKNF